jgi:inner membrane protein
VAAICAPAGHRRKGLLVGAVLGTLPDLDVLIRYGDAVRDFTYHRGFSHSLFVLTPVASLLWLALRRWWAPVRAAPGRWFWAILLALATHPLIDAHTAYGTQLWWPLPAAPVSWATLFIIDPLYTLPLVVGVAMAAFRPMARRSGAWLAAGLVLSSLYLGWSWAGRTLVMRHAEASLARAGLEDRPIFLTPTPFNTLLWRVVVMTDDGYLQGYDSLLVREGPLRFEPFPSDVEALEEAAEIWAVQRLRWFSKGFLGARVDNDRLVLSDLRMGGEPTYVFSHVVARRGNPSWQAVKPERLRPDFTGEDLKQVWSRIWQDSALYLGRNGDRS